MTDTPFEIPKSMRDAAEQSVTQAKSAYDQFIDASRQAQDMVEKSQGSMLTAAKDIQQKSLAFAAENAQAGFSLAEKLIRAKDFQETLEIQATFARQQMEAYSRQARELTTMMADASKKAQQS
jgi:phasin